MEQNENKYVAVAYDLYAIDETGRHLVERAPENEPFVFLSGFGIALEAFEKELVGQETGSNFDFTLTTEQGYGLYDEERVLELDRDLFTIDGRFDRERIFIDAIVPLQNQEGDRFMARVIDIRDQVVVVDLNHPLAGKELNFQGTVVENRPATDDEIQKLIRQLTGEGCGGCGGCGGDGGCNADGEGCGKKGCGNCHQ